MFKTWTWAMVFGLGGVMAAGVVAQDKGASPNEGARNPAEQRFSALHAAYLEKYKPLFLQSEQAWWTASVTGSDEAFEKRKQAQNALVELHSDSATFAELKALKEGGQVADPLLQRLLEVMYRKFLAGQGDVEIQKRIVALEADAEQIFNTHRGVIDGQPRSENEIREILSGTGDSALAEKAWKAYMEVGMKVQGQLKELVALRNQQARQLGFDNYFAMKLALEELDETQLFKIFDELDALTREPFAELKGRIDTKMAARFGLSPADLRPWHFGDLFFQESPQLEEVNLDQLVGGKDILAAASAYYAGLGMPVEDILARSDLYEKEGKSPHAFCTNINRADDIRVLCNIKPNAYWLDTVLHELGHAVYDKYIGADVPFVIHEPAHTMTTEGIAMMFGAMSKNQEWLTQVLGVPADRAAEVSAAARRTLQAEKLIFSRWAQVMARFEQGMYSKPDQDLGALWWDLKARYQLLNPPDDKSRPDYGAKYHVVGAPVYYHNYLLGDLFGCQVHEYVATRVLKVSDPLATSFNGRKEAGDYLKAKVFGPGNLHSWNALTEMATGAPLSAQAFARQYVGTDGAK